MQDEPWLYTVLGGTAVAIIIPFMGLLLKLFPSLLKNSEIQDNIADRVWQRAQKTMDRMERRMEALETENELLKDRVSELEQDNMHLEQRIQEVTYQRDKYKALAGVE